MSVDITNINKQFFLEKPVPKKDQADKIRESIATYQKFLDTAKKNKDKAVRDFEKEEVRYKQKIKELKEELELHGEKL